MSTIKTSNLMVVGTIANIIVKPTRQNKETGEVTPEHLQINFAMMSTKGLELIKVKDIKSIHRDKKDGQDVSIPVRVTMSQNGQTYYEAL